MRGSLVLLVDVHTWYFLFTSLVTLHVISWGPTMGRPCATAGTPRAGTVRRNGAPGVCEAALGPEVVYVVPLFLSLDLSCVSGVLSPFFSVGGCRSMSPYVVRT